MSKIEIQNRQSGRTTNMLGQVRDDLQKGYKVVLIVPPGLVGHPDLEGIKPQLFDNGGILKVYPLSSFSEAQHYDFELMVDREYPNHKLYIDHSLLAARFGKMIDQYFNFY